MCKRANRHITERIRYWRMDIRASTLRSPIERDGPLPWPLRTGRGALHAHARAPATGSGPSPAKRRAKRVRHGRLRQPTSAGTRRPSKRFAAVSAALGRAEPPRRRSRASRHHCAAGHQTVHENHTEDASAVSCWARIMAHAGGISNERCEVRDWGRYKGGRQAYRAGEVPSLSLLKMRPKVPKVLAEEEVDLATSRRPEKKLPPLACGVKTRGRATQN